MHNNSLFYRILLDDFGIGGVPATVTEGGNEDFEVGDLQLKMYKLIKTNKCTSVKAVGDPGDDHECPLGCEESMPRSRLWPHVAYCTPLHTPAAQYSCTGACRMHIGIGHIDRYIATGSQRVILAYLYSRPSATVLSTYRA